jgi:hypothetical protein
MPLHYRGRRAEAIYLTVIERSAQRGLNRVPAAAITGRLKGGLP